MAAPFSSRCPKILKMKKILCLKIAEIDIGKVGVIFVSRRTILDIKLFFKLNLFSGGKYRNLMTCSLLPREIL